MATWRVAKSLLTFRDQLNKLSPGRNRSSDGFIGDAAHRSRTSDHNPWVRDGKIGVVTAGDFTHDVTKGVDTHRLSEHLRQQRDTRIKYVISNHRIFSSVTSPWTWRRYTGSNPHVSHMHVSVHSSKNHYDATHPWHLPGISGPSDPDDPKVRPILKRGMTGENVRAIQNILGIPVDGIFGIGTESTVKKFQRSWKIRDDGIVGPVTWGLLDRIEQREDGEHEGDDFSE